MTKPFIASSYDGKNYYPYLIIKQTAKTATVQPCDVFGKPMGDKITKRYATCHGVPAIDLNRFETVYLTQKYTLAA